MISMDGFDCGGHPGRCTRTQPAWPVPGHPNPIQLDFRPLHQKMCEAICGSKLHYLCHVINILFTMTYYDCGIEAETVTFGHTGEEDVGNWVLLAQASQESVRFSEALGFVRNKIEQDPTQPLAMVIAKSLLHLLVKGVEDPFCGQWW